MDSKDNVKSTEWDYIGCGVVSLEGAKWMSVDCNSELCWNTLFFKYREMVCKNFRATCEVAI